MSAAGARVLRGLQERPADNDERLDFARGQELMAALNRRTDVVGDLGEELAGLAPTDTVADAHARASSPAPKAVLLYRLARCQRPRRVVELGTGFGVGTAHLRMALDRNGDGARLITVEGSAPRQAVARSELVRAGLEGIDFVAGLFDDHLEQLDGADFVFVDGNHYLEPTLRYVQEAARRGIRPLSIVLDDVAEYSEEMDEAWRRVSPDPQFSFAAAWLGLGVVTLGATPLGGRLGVLRRLRMRP